MKSGASRRHVGEQVWLNRAAQSRPVRIAPLHTMFVGFFRKKLRHRFSAGAKFTRRKSHARINGMNKEFISCEPGYGDAWVCICGNTPCGNGFYPCDENGNQVEPTAKEWKTDLYVCDPCGRMIHFETLEVIGRRKQPVEIVLV